MVKWEKKEDFILWVKHVVESDKQTLYAGKIPWVLIKREVHLSETHKVHIRKNDYYKKSLFKQCKDMDEKATSRLSTIVYNLQFKLEHFEKISDLILDEKLLEIINDNHFNKLEPHHYYVFLHAVEQVNFFIESKIMRYNDLFSIPKDKYEMAIQKIKEQADRVQFFFSDDLIDNQVRIRLPINPKIVISQMIWDFDFQGDEDGELGKYFQDMIINYFSEYKKDKKIQKTLYNNFYMDYRKYPYGLKVESSMYFYEPQIKQNYFYKR